MKTEPMKTVTVSLSPEQAARLQEAVDSGAYASDSEIVHDALDLWEKRENVRDLEIARLKKAYDEGMARGGGREVDARTLLAELKAEARTRG
jgi:antitoxin ParD1/3/4